MWTKTFWRAAIERAAKTFAQTLAAMLVADGSGLLDARWLALLSVAGMAALVSVLTSIGSAGITDGSPSLTDAEVLTAPADDSAYQPPERAQLDD